MPYLVRDGSGEYRVVQYEKDAEELTQRSGGQFKEVSDRRADEIRSNVNYHYYGRLSLGESFDEGREE